LPNSERRTDCDGRDERDYRLFHDGDDIKTENISVSRNATCLVREKREGFIWWAEGPERKYKERKLGISLSPSLAE